MNNQLALLKALDIPLWMRRAPTQPHKETSAQNLQGLQTCVATCQRCPLHKTRTKTVFGTGNASAKVMVIGEAPGFYEDQQGEPFVGRAGQLLNAMLHSIGFQRGDVYIANILKCRPPNNRDPLPEEVLACTPYLNQQIELIRPTMLCAVGRIAGQYLLQTTLSLGKLREKVHRYGESQLPLIITYHPAYLLRNPVAKAQAYQDLLQLKELTS